jgi:hypothetical protein
MVSATTVRDHVAGLAAPQLKSLLGDFQRARSAMDATWFRILTELEGASAHLSDGARDTVTFVSNNTGESMGAIQRDLDAASKLGVRAPGVTSPPGGSAGPPGFEQPQLLPLAGA